MRSTHWGLLALVACATHQPVTTPDPAPTPEPAAEQAATEAPVEQTTVAVPAVEHASNEAFVADDLDVAQWTARFESAEREVFAQRGPIVAAMQLAPGSTVADIGAGTGAMLDVLVEAVGPEGTVIATELSAGFRTHLQARAAEAGWSQVQVRESFVDATGLDDASIDAALLVDVYHHLENPTGFVDDLARALKPGGTLHIVDFDPGSEAANDWVREHVPHTAAEVVAQVLGTGHFEALPEPDAGLTVNKMTSFRRK